MGTPCNPSTSSSVQCEDELAQAQAMSLLPLDELIGEIQEAQLLNASFGDSTASLASEQDLLAQKLLHWFKHCFMAWTDNPPCQACGSKDTKFAKRDHATPDESAYQASR